MKTHDDMPPTGTIREIGTPPPSTNPTTAQLKADIDSGATGDKNPVFDPGLSPLGTDDEAAGTPAEPHRIRLARRMEGARRWMTGARRSSFAHGGRDMVAYAYAGGDALIGAILAGGIVLVRS